MLTVTVNRLIEAIRKSDVHWLLHLLKESEASQTDLDEALHTAAWMGEAESVRLLLAAGASLQSVSQHQEPLIVVAVYSNNVDVVRTLIQAGYNIASSGAGDAATQSGIPNPLHLAISSREHPNYEIVDLLLEAGVDPECKDVDGDTPFIAACNMGDVTLARKLLSVKCQVNASGYEGNTALHRAVESGSEELVQLLLANKTNVSARNATGNTPLMVACENGNDVLARMLLSNGGKETVTETNVEGKNCMHLAAVSGKLELMELLMEAGVSCGSVDTFGNSPLIMAIIMKNSDFVLSLLDHISRQGGSADQVSTVGELGRTALHWAAMHDLANVAERLINAGGPGIADLRDECGDSALILAAKAGSRLTLPLLIRRGSDVNIFGELGRTALHWAILGDNGEATETILSAPRLDINAVDQMGNTALTLAALSRRYGELLCLARHPKADVNHRGEQGRTIFHWLCQSGQTDTVRELSVAATNAIDPNVTDNSGDTSLLLALKNKQSTTAIEILTSSASWLSPVNIGCIDSTGRIPLHYAASEGFSDVVQLLVAKAADVNHRDNAGCSALTLAAKSGHESVVGILIDGGCEVNVIDNEHRTPLFYAAQSGLKEAMERLIQAGADPDLKGSESSPLIQAAKGGFTAIVQILVSRGAGINHRDNQGRTALMCAAQGGHVDIMKVLLGQGASGRIEDVSGDSALTIAAWHGHLEVVRVLLSVSDIEHRERDEGMTALHLAIAKDSKDIVVALLEAGADVNALDSKSNNCLLTAMIHTGGSEIVSLILRQCPPLDINFIGDQARSALHWAVGDTDCLRMVLDHKPDIDLVDSNGASALLLAIAHSKPDSAQMLIDAGADFRRVRVILTEIQTR